MVKVGVVRSRSGLLVAVSFVASAALSCEGVDNSGAVETKVGALSGPIQSISQTQGVAPVNITQTTSPDGLSSTSFTIGLFNEDAASCEPANRSQTLAKCAIDADINPMFRGDLETYTDNTPVLPMFDDTSVVEVKINVGSSKKLHWDWKYNAYYQQPYNMFQVNVVAQNGQVTNVVPVVSAPAGWGWNPCGPNLQQIYAVGPQAVDLDLTPWANQTIKLQFSLRNFYDPHFTDNCLLFIGPSCPDFPCVPFPPGVWDIPTAKAYVTNLHLNSCSDAINNGLTVTANGADISASFTPNLGLSLQDAALLCGFVNFDWVQIITVLNDPVTYFALNEGGAFDPTITGPVRLSSARTPFHDPPQGGGYTYELELFGQPDYSFPFYYNWLPPGGPSELSGQENGGFTLTFQDAPDNPCLPGGRGEFTPDCSNSVEPPGSFTHFTNHLVGIKSDGSYTDLHLAFDWNSNFNGTSGGVTVEKTNLLADNNGTGGVTITSVREITNYQGPGAPTVVDTTPPTISIVATPSILWPPNGKLVTVTVSGTIQDNSGGSGVDPSSSNFFVVDQYGQIQPVGGVTVASNGSYSFSLQLKASRDGNDPNGRRYTISVNASDNNGNSASATARVVVPHDQRH